MNMFKQLSGLLWKNEKSDLIQIRGTFHDVDRGQWRCLFNNCEAKISRTSEPYKWEFSVTRLIEDGEEIDPEDTNAYSFVIQESMRVTKEMAIGEGVAFSFYGNGNKMFVFELDPEDGKMGDFLIQTLANCMYEYKHKQSHESAKYDEINGFIRDATSSPVATKTQSRQQTPQNQTPAKSSSTPLSKYSTPVKTSPFTSAPKTPMQSASPATPAMSQPKDLPPPSPVEIRGQKIFETQAKLFRFNADSSIFDFQSEVNVHITSTGNGKTTFQYFLILTTKDGRLAIDQEINDQMFLNFNEETHSMVWVFCLGANVWTWSLQFDNYEEEDKFKNFMARCIYEKNTQTPFSKVKDDAAWILSAFETHMKLDDKDEDDDMAEIIDPAEEEALEEKKEESEDESEEEEEPEPESEDSEEESEGEDAQQSNKLLTVGFRTDRSFVARGSKIGVFKNTPNKVQYKTAITNLKDKEGKKFSPKRMMLHQGDSSLLMLHPDKNNKVYRMDLNRPDVVEEWKVHDDVPVTELLPGTKYAQTTDEQTLLGMNNLGFMHIDPRLSGSKMVQNQAHTYKASTRPQLSCAATTSEGQMVVGSKTGMIRLFSQKTVATPTKEIEAAPRAKNTIPGLGDPILGVDVTADGAWILATCKTYLLLIPTEVEGKNGFETPLGTSKKPPLRLQLKNTDIIKMSNQVTFTPAKFNIGTDTEESIVTSTGPYIITWNFKKVKQGMLFDYQIKQYEDNIVGDQFRYGDSRSIILATPNNVKLAKRSVVKTFSPPRQ
eukprot:TRINITY_DN2081_c0_g1_i1.p1 TRINITY_DN2081_c0_g1~~TRINITY_DN2081_c0_g1_i1.p1  ORF type:complete len:774 (+),score=271.60 TRINITY_DN2081_c0_g1_i1:168-2489(+)